jgi:hypothetical protein
MNKTQYEQGFHDALTLVKETAFRNAAITELRYLVKDLEHKLMWYGKMRGSIHPTSITIDNEIIVSGYEVGKIEPHPSGAGYYIDRYILEGDEIGLMLDKTSSIDMIHVE